MKEVEVAISWDKNYGAHCNLIPGCVATGRNLEDVKREFTKSLKLHLSGMVEDGEEIPVELRGEYKLVFHLNAQALLNYTEGIISRKALSDVTGINLQQLSHYARGWRNPRPEMQQRIVTGIHELGNQLIAVSL
ncbi:MAG: type II toxin-antitoxin system HicB family antitoxin [Culturomica sp.]|jgi:predicted RNase H-like HicB family nuclease|nr:type II toxin-antitoxin system HicB family antitoxin [Culturomica sp.]